MHAPIPTTQRSRTPDLAVPAWHTLSPEAALAEQESSANGLASAEAARRLTVYGPNEVEPEHEAPWWTLLLRQFRDPLIYLLLVAAAVTLAVQDYTDSAVILAVVALNAIIGFVQELSARKESRALARLSAPRAEVLRDGERRVIAGRDVVPGDVVVLTSGARVPADLRLLAANDLSADESLLTGESLPASKRVEAMAAGGATAADRRNMAFAGTVVTRGRGRGLVVRTGDGTEIGRIAESMRNLGTGTTPLQEEFARLGRRVGLVVLGLAVAIVAIGLLRGMPAAEIFLVAVAAAVAAIPEGLPVVLTVTLAIGVRRMAARNAIVRALPAVETLGSTTVIASDKTGTLTQNRMTVRRVRVGGETFDLPFGAGDGDAAPSPAEDALPGLRRALLVGALANEARAAAGVAEGSLADPLETALLDSAAEGGITADLLDAHPEQALLPFESERRMMAALVGAPAGPLLVAKGAPEALVRRCTHQLEADGTVAPLDAQAAIAAAAALAGAGMRVIATAYREPVDSDAAARFDDDALSRLTLAGLHALEDPVRPEAVAAVAAAREAGIRVLMLTGDHAATAGAIGAQLGLGEVPGEASRVVEGAALDGIDDDELDRLIADVPAFARVAPEHKLRIVQRLRATGEIVAVTGDGVNDAPALRAAHLGVAMGRGGTDVAREAADMVLADDNFATITAAVEEGRVVFANVRKVTFFLLGTGVGQVITVLASLLAGWPLPFTAAQILWINLVTNGLQDVALAFEPGEPGLLRRRPRPAGEGILTVRLLERLAGVGAVLAAGTLTAFWLTLEATGDIDAARTMAMTQMVVFQFFHVFNCRSLDRSVFAIPPLSNRFLFVSLVAAAAAHLAVIYTAPLQALFRTVPLGAGQWALLVAIGACVVVGGEADKWRNRRGGRLIG